MDKLRIFNYEELGGMRFDQIMDCDGGWIDTKTIYMVDYIKELQLNEVNFRYYIFENYDGKQAILRNKKKIK